MVDEIARGGDQIGPRGQIDFADQDEGAADTDDVAERTDEMESIYVDG